MGKIMRFNRHFVKYDNMPPNSKLIYNLPFSHYFINAYITVVPPGAVYLLAQVALGNKRFLSLTEDDFKDLTFVKKPWEYYSLLIVILGFVVIITKCAHEWPIRIYRGQNNQYTALFINKLNPFRVTKYNFEEVSKAKTWKLAPWHECRHILGNKKPVGIFDHHVEPPIEYFQMMTPRNLRKPSASS